MPQLTFEECKKAHEEMWKWLSENPYKDKHDWPGWVDTLDRFSCDDKEHYYHCPGGVYGSVFIPYFCFACYWACGDNRMNDCSALESISISKRDCRKCPVDWCENGNVIMAIDKDDTVCTAFSEFDLWMDARHYDNKKDRKKLAKLIAKKEWTDKSTVQNADISHED